MSQLILIHANTELSKQNGGEMVPMNGLQTDMGYGTRRKRRIAVKSIHDCLLSIRDAEQKYLENTPVNFQNSESFEIGEHAVDTLDEIIDLLVEVY
jgi:hypothetical protein